MCVMPAVYHGGFVLLPLLWLVNVWLFWPDFRHGHDPEVAKCEHHCWSPWLPGVFKNDALWCLISVWQHGALLGL